MSSHPSPSCTRIPHLITPPPPTPFPQAESGEGFGSPPGSSTCSVCQPDYWFQTSTQTCATCGVGTAFEGFDCSKVPIYIEPVCESARARLPGMNTTTQPPQPSTTFTPFSPRLPRPSARFRPFPSLFCIYSELPTTVCGYPLAPVGTVI